MSGPAPASARDKQKLVETIEDNDRMKRELDRLKAQDNAGSLFDLKAEPAAQIARVPNRQGPGRSHQGQARQDESTGRLTAAHTAEARAHPGFGIYPAHTMIRNFLGSMTRKLSVTSSQ